MDAIEQAWLDQMDAQLTQAIRRYGWWIQYVGGGDCANPECGCSPDDSPPFAYTIGLFGMNHPELLILGVSPQRALTVLNDLGERIRQGETFIAGQAIDVSGVDHPLVAENVPNPGDIVFWANDFYQRPPEFSVPVLQLAYADDQGRYPWDEGCNVALTQPRPGTFAA
jgi:hypothetical protein